MFIKSFIQPSNYPLKKIFCYIIALQILILSVVNFNFEYAHAAQITTVLTDNFENDTKWDFTDGNSSDFEFENGRVKNIAEDPKFLGYNLSTDYVKTVTLDVYRDTSFISNDAIIIDIVGKDKSNNEQTIQLTNSITINSNDIGDADSVSLEEFTFTLPETCAYLTLTMRYNADMFKEGVTMTPGKVEISKVLITIEQDSDFIDNMDDSSKMSWPSNLTFNTDNSGLFGDSSTALQTSNDWAWFAYKVPGAKRIELEVFTKSEIGTDIDIQTSPPNEDNYTSSDYVNTNWVTLESGWYKVTLVSLLPEETNMLQITLKDTSDDKFQIGKVSMFYNAGTIPVNEALPPPPTIIADQLNDLNATSWSDGLIFNTSNQNGFEDSSTVLQENDAWGWFHYYMAGAKRMEAVVYTKTDFDSNKIKIESSPDATNNIISSDYVKTGWQILSNGWYKVTIVSIIPDGNNFAGIVLKATGEDKPQIGSIRISDSPGILPADEAMPTAQVTPDTGGNEGDTSQEISDPLDNLDLMNWHSVEGEYGLGDLEFNTSNTYGFDDISTVHQASDHWAEFNYHLDGAKTIEATIYTKSAISQDILQLTACTNSDNNGATNPTYITTDWIALEDGWYKVTLIASLADNTNYVGIKLKGSTTKPEIGLIRISTSAETLPANQNMPGTPDDGDTSAEVSDPLDNLNLLNWHSVEGENGLGDLELNTSNTDGFNDTSTIRQASDHWAEFNYHLNNAKTFEATIYTKAEISEDILQLTSSPNSNNSDMTSPEYVKSGWTALENGWFKVTLTASLPDNSNYIGIKLKGSGNRKPEVGAVRISRTDIETLPADEEMPLEIIDPLNDFSMTNWHSVEGKYDLGDLEFNTSNSNGFNDPSTVRQSSKSWSIFNYNLNNSKWFEAVVYTKTDLNSKVVEITASPNSDGSEETYPSYVCTGWTTLQNGWYKVTVKAILPDGTNYTGLRLKGYGNKPEIGSVKISKTAETLPEDSNPPSNILSASSSSGGGSYTPPVVKREMNVNFESFKLVNC